MNPNYLLIDGARLLSSLNMILDKNKNHICLYKGLAEETLSAYAPYLISFDKESEFASWYLKESKNESWGIFIQSKLSLEELNKHLRKFLKVKTENGKALYFRFYDPRVLRIFLPTCDKKQIIEFFGNQQSLICEQEDDDEFIIYSHKEGELVTTKGVFKTSLQNINSEPMIETQSTEDTLTKKKSRNWDL